MANLRWAIVDQGQPPPAASDLDVWKPWAWQSDRAQVAPVPSLTDHQLCLEALQNWQVIVPPPTPAQQPIWAPAACQGPWPAGTLPDQIVFTFRKAPGS